MKFLLVYGGDYSAMEFENNYDVQEVYSTMKINNERKIVLETAIHDAIYVELREFGEVDPEFINFIHDEMIDYDTSKDKNFYFVEDK